jgi:oxygen-dependent protoporphyrinogen oxidase
MIFSHIKPYKIIHIYGAGFAGLVIGNLLAQENIPFYLHEKSTRPGGKLQTSETPFGITEHAANAIFCDKKLLDFLIQNKLKPIEAAPKLKRKIKINQRIFNKPFGLTQLIRILLKSFKKVPRTLKLESASLADFLIPWLGEKNVRQIVSTALLGIYSAGAFELNALSVLKIKKFPKRYINFIWNMIVNAKKNKKQSYSFKNGMQELVDQLASMIETHIQYNSNVTLELLDEKSLHIICTDATDASNLLNKTCNQDIISALNAIEYKKITSSTIFTKQEIKNLDKSFGILFNQSDEHIHYGILNNCTIFPDRSIDGHFSYTLIGPLRDVGKIESDIKHSLSKIGFDQDFVVYPHHWERAIPVYNHLRLRKVNTLKNELPENIVLLANYTNGISLREIFHNCLDLIPYLKSNYKAD